MILHPAKLFTNTNRNINKINIDREVVFKDKKLIKIAIENLGYLNKNRD